MSRRQFIAPAVIVYTMLAAAAAVASGPPAPATFGASWDGPGHDLQTIVDAYIGVPGAVNTHADYIGGRLGDIDPWFWLGKQVPALIITEVAGNANRNAIGWYLENGSPPALDGVHDGIVFTGPQGAGASNIVVFPTDMTRFGFYLDTHHLVTTATGTREQVYFTNRHFNDPGPGGAGAMRAPWDGDVQALVYDVSRWKGPNTWLVCFEDLDAGAAITPCCTGTDSDYNDFVFQVSALGATPTSTLSFGSLKARYR